MSTEVLREQISFKAVNERPPLQAFFEEDVLIPDIKPDAGRINSSRIIPRITEKESYGGNIKLGGDIYLEVLYSPSNSLNTPTEVAMARIPFRYEAPYEEFSGELELLPRVEHLEVSMINERKFRMKTVIGFAAREYEEVERSCFKGFEDGSMEKLERLTKFTDIAEHKKEYIEVKDELTLKEGMAEIGVILRNDFRVAQGYRQITPEKAILSGTIYYDILYMSEASEPEPVNISGKTDFTQFIKLDMSSDIAGSDILMRVDDVKLTPKRDEEDNMTIIEIVVGIATRIDIYVERSAGLVVDAYHRRDILEAEREELRLMRFCGSGSKDISIRQRIDIKSDEGVDRSIFASAEAIAVGGEEENGKFFLEGVLAVELLYSQMSDKGLWSTTTEIPFSAEVTVPGLKAGMQINADFVVKSITTEKTKEHQLEIYAEIETFVKCFELENIGYIKNAILIEDTKDNEENLTRLIIHVTKGNESLWDIGKRYRLSPEEIKRLNGIDSTLPADSGLNMGDKLLLWA